MDPSSAVTTPAQDGKHAAQCRTMMNDEAVFFLLHSSCNRTSSLQCSVLNKLCRSTGFCNPNAPCTKMCKGGYVMKGNCALCQCKCKWSDAGTKTMIFTARSFA